MGGERVTELQIRKLDVVRSQLEAAIFLILSEQSQIACHTLIIASRNIL